MNIRDAALSHLANRSRTVKEMERHLLRKGFEEGEIKALIEEFLEYGYLDDSRYCQVYFDYAFSRGKGRRRVISELREKGVDQSVIDIAFEEYEPEEDEETRARKEVAKVLRMAGIEEGDAVPEKILARIARKLQSRGYSTDLIYRIIGDFRI